LRRFRRVALSTSGTPSATVPMPMRSKFERSPQSLKLNPASARSRKSPCPEVWEMKAPEG
jgi:hypothetical protein